MKNFLTEERQKGLIKYVKKYYEENKFDFVHDFDHILRTLYWAVLISKKEKVNLSIIIPAAILHDISLSKVSDNEHARESANMCKAFLKKFGYTNTETEKISETIKLHSTDDPSFKKTIEGKVLFDADKLDATGPFPFYRWLFEYQRKNYKSHEIPLAILNRLKVLKKFYGKDIFLTDTGKKLGRLRLKYVENISKGMIRDSKKFKRLYDEIKKL